MAVSPLGGYIYTNQASPFVSQIHQQTLNHPEMVQFSLNQNLVEKEKEVEKVEQSNEGHGINPDRDANDNDEMYNKKGKKEEEEPEEEKEPEVQIIEAYHLDIKV